MESPDQSAPPSATTAEVVYRCKICGIESPETSCFAGIATNGPYRLSGTCITCNQPFGGNETWRRVVALIVLIAFPTIYLVATRGTQQIGLIGLLLVAALIHPLLTMLHEMGHALTAKVVGLEVNLITLGVGRFLCAGTIWETPIRLYAWPMLGLTFLGGRPSRFQRTRLWLTTLMGPVTNLGLMTIAIILWKPLGSVLDQNVILLWIVFNAITVLTNLWPHRFRQSGRLYPTDGMQLFQIPFKKTAALAEALSLGKVGSILVTYNDGEYSAAKEACMKDLQRQPANPWLMGLLSACHINLGDYESGRATVEPLLESTVTLSPEHRAAVQNNLAVALWLRDFNSPQLEQSLPRADVLSADAYRTYPCVLAHRTSRALILTAINRSEDALALLEYMNYEKGSANDRANHQIARAFALRRLNRTEEAEQALAAGLKLTKKRLPWLSTIGLMPQ